jgi:hypothetical protein
VSVSAADLLYSVGLIREDWFPGEDVPGNLTLWLAQAADAETPAGATPEQADAIAKAYAYWRAFDAKLDLLAASPDTANLEGVGGRSINDQRKWFNTKAERWRLAFLAAVTKALAAEEIPGTGDEGASRPSQSVAFTVAL